MKASFNLEKQLAALEKELVNLRETATAQAKDQRQEKITNRAEDLNQRPMLVSGDVGQSPETSWNQSMRNAHDLASTPPAIIHTMWMLNQRAQLESPNLRPNSQNSFAQTQGIVSLNSISTPPNQYRPIPTSQGDLHDTQKEKIIQEILRLKEENSQSDIEHVRKCKELKGENQKIKQDIMQKFKETIELKKEIARLTLAQTHRDKLIYENEEVQQELQKKQEELHLLQRQTTLNLGSSSIIKDISADELETQSVAFSDQDRSIDSYGNDNDVLTPEPIRPHSTINRSQTPSQGLTQIRAIAESLKLGPVVRNDSRIRVERKESNLRSLRKQRAQFQLEIDEMDQGSRTTRSNRKTSRLQNHIDDIDMKIKSLLIQQLNFLLIKFGDKQNSKMDLEITQNLNQKINKMFEEGQRKLRPRTQPQRQPNNRITGTPYQPPARQGSMATSEQAQYSLNQSLDLNLRRMAGDNRIPDRMKKQPLLKLLKETSRDLLLNQIEVAVWCVYLERYVWGSATDTDLPNLLLFSAFAAKTYLNDDCQSVQEYITKHKIANFSSLYNEWLRKHRASMTIRPKEINEKFAELNRELDEENDLTDYRFYVDDILHVYPTSLSDQSEPVMGQHIEVERQDSIGLFKSESPELLFRSVPSETGIFGADQFLPLCAEEVWEAPSNFSSVGETEIPGLPNLEPSMSLVSSLFKKPN